MAEQTIILNALDAEASNTLGWSLFGGFPALLRIDVLCCIPSRRTSFAPSIGNLRACKVPSLPGDLERNLSKQYGYIVERPK